MTNREWLNTLSDKEFVEWLIYDEMYEVSNGYIKMYQPTPKLATLARSSTQTETFIKEWLKEDRNEPIH